MIECPKNNVISVIQKRIDYYDKSSNERVDAKIALRRIRDSCERGSKCCLISKTEQNPIFYDCYGAGIKKEENIVFITA